MVYLVSSQIDASQLDASQLDVIIYIGTIYMLCAIVVVGFYNLDFCKLTEQYICCNLWVSLGSVYRLMAQLRGNSSFCLSVGVKLRLWVRIVGWWCSPVYDPGLFSHLH